MSSALTSTFRVQDLVPRMTGELGYKPDLAERIAHRLTVADEPIKAAFWRWWTTGELDQSIEAWGYTTTRLMTEHGLAPLAAFSTLAWLQNDPQQALRALRYGAVSASRTSTRRPARSIAKR